MAAYSRSGLTDNKPCFFCFVFHWSFSLYGKLARCSTFEFFLEFWDSRCLSFIFVFFLMRHANILRSEARRLGIALLHALADSTVVCVQLLSQSSAKSIFASIECLTIVSTRLRIRIIFAVEPLNTIPCRAFENVASGACVMKSDADLRAKLWLKTAFDKILQIKRRRTSRYV
jgi:hypothetical protein